LSAASEVLDTVMVIDAVLTTSRWASAGGGGPNSGAGAVTPSFMPAAGAVVMPLPCGDVFSCDPEQPVSMPNTAIPAIAGANHLRPNLRETRFMIINLAIGCEVRQRRSKGPYSGDCVQAETSGFSASPTVVMTPGV
jgi:hypothetical protein